MQSPINIVTKRALRDDSLEPVHYHGYQEAFHSAIINNGHYAQIDLPDNVRIVGGSLETTYKAVQLHFHWGNNGGPGSEHTIDGEQYPMEMHIVHIKHHYSSLTEALHDRTGVAVLGFFYQESQSSNKKYDSIVNALQNITIPGSNISLNALSVDTFIPPRDNLTKYYRYHGSLTTPGCAESVVWTLFEEPIPLSRDQLSAFSRLTFMDGQSMKGNFRPTQPLNGREVHFSGTVRAWANTAVLLSSVLVIYLLTD